MITIKKNKKIKIQIPEFLCDGPIGEHLNQHDLLKSLNKYSFSCFIGRPGSGKSSLAIAFLTQKNPKIFKKTHHHILCIVPSNSLGSMKKNPFSVLPEENMYTELSDDIIDDIYNRISVYSEDNEKTILYLDDVGSSLKASKYIQDILKKIVYNRRHLKCNIFILVQSYVDMPLSIRKTISNAIIFRPSKREMKTLFEEVFESKRSVYEEIMRVSFVKPHDFLFLNIPDQKIFSNWNEIIIID